MRISCLASGILHSLKYSKVYVLMKVAFITISRSIHCSTPSKLSASDFLVSFYKIKKFHE